MRKWFPIYAFYQLVELYLSVQNLSGDGLFGVFRSVNPSTKLHPQKCESPVLERYER